MKSTPGLVRREGTYYARVRVPKLLVETLRKAEIKISLKTAIYEEAKARLPGALARIQRQIAEASNSFSVDIPELIEIGRAHLEQIARAWFEPKWHAHESILWKPFPSHLLQAETRHNIEISLNSLCPPDDVAYGAYLLQARRHLSKEGYPQPTSTSVDTLAQFMIRGEIECLHLCARYFDQPKTSQVPPSDPLFRSVGASGSYELATTHIPAAAGITVDKAIERFKSDREKKNLSERGIAGYETGFKLLRELVGGCAPLATVNRDHAREIRDVLGRLPPNASKIFPDMTLMQAAAHASANGIPPLQAKTADNNLANFSSFFTWAINEHLIDKHPAKGLKPHQKPRSREELPQPFSMQDLVTLFSDDLYRQPYRSVDPKHLGHYWVPLLALYHGARCNELCQLEIADIKTEDGIPFMRITEASETGEEKHLKTANAQRIVPIHPVIQSLGFVEYVDELRDKGSSRVFPDLKKSGKRYYSDNFSKWFGRFKERRGLTDRRLKFHSFRHGFNDACRSAKVPRDVIGELCGWSNGSSMLDHYGSGHSLRRKADAIAEISFPLVEKLFPALQSVNDQQAGSSSGCEGNKVDE